MTINELKQSDRVCVNANDIAPVIGADPAWIRYQAHTDPSKLGFPVIVIKRRVKIPRVPFLQFIGEAAV